MTKCNMPPPGWICSREPGHEGPCAARRKRPYDEYVNKAVDRSGLLWASEVFYRDKEVVFSRPLATISLPNLQRLLTNAWMAGLAHSLELIEPKKRTA